MAWTGMRPLATSWPPERRSATAMGAAQRFSQTSTAATVPGSSAVAASSRSSWPSRPDDAPSNSARPASSSSSVEVDRRDRPVQVLGEERDVEDPDEPAVDEVQEQRHHLAGDRRVAGHSMTM